jgi:hypothetical protein
LDVIGKLKRPDGTFVPSLFESDFTRREPSTMSRLTSPASSVYLWKERGMLEGTTPTTTGYPGMGSSARNNENQLLALQLLATTHPFAPVFSVPVAIKELAEVAGMFKLAAKGFASYVGGQYLNYRFGWKAFIRDIQTLHGITKEIEKRFLDFNHLLEHGNTRKRRTLGVTGGRTGGANTTLHSAYGRIVRGTTYGTWAMRTYGTVTWGVNGERLVPVDDLKRFNLAVQTIFDLGEIDAPTLYELVPFSWLVDYFYTIGDALHSQHMKYNITPYDVCIMRHWLHRVRHVPLSYDSDITINKSGQFVREIKTRDVVNPTSTPILTFDLLRGDRWKVILALAGKFSRA